MIVFQCGDDRAHGPHYWTAGNTRYYCNGRATLSWTYSLLV